MSNDLSFTFQKQNDEYHIFHNGKKATVLRGEKAHAFSEEVEFSSFVEQQQLMARLTGNYKRGNERTAKNHPRNSS